MKNWRINIVFFLFLISFGFIVFKLYKVQIKNGEYYGVLALGQQFSFKENSEERGSILLEKDGLILAQMKLKNIVYLFGEKFAEFYQNPEEFENKVRFLAETLGENKETLSSLVKEKKFFKKEISDETLEKLKNEKIEGVYLDTFWGRIYPEKTLACHVIGFLNEDGTGQYGVENYYDKTLGRTKGLTQKANSPFVLLGSTFKNTRERGKDIILTLNYNIQYFSEKLLAEAGEKWNIDSGTIIVEEPKTGKILALANFPSFNPNEYSKEENFGVFLNAAIQTLFEPGSVFKAITMAGGLEEKLIAPDTKYEDKGFVALGGPPIYNYKKRVWGEQTMTDVLEESINTGAVFVEQKLGKDVFWKYLEKFGLFEKTGIDLQGEIFSQNETLKNGYPRDFASASFGQGIQITSLQFVRAFSAIANEGKMMAPYVTEKIIEESGKETITEPKIQKEVISSETASKLTLMLINVVEQGSARNAKIEGYSIAGKTGTAQVPIQKGGYSEDQTIQSFIGYFPAFSPRVLIFVKFDNPKGVGEAGQSAVPVFKKLAKYIIDLWQIPPDKN